MSSSLISQDIGPMVVGYGLVMGALAVGLRVLRRSGPGPGAESGAGSGAKPEPASRAAQTGRPAGGSLAAGRTERAGLAGRAERAERAERRGIARARSALRVVDRFEPGWPRLIAHIVVTVVGGYLLLMIVLILYYLFVVAYAGNFIQSGFTGCGLLIGLSVPLFLGASWLAARTGWRF
jgi:hypothetical protein